MISELRLAQIIATISELSEQKKQDFYRFLIEIKDKTDSTVDDKQIADILLSIRELYRILSTKVDKVNGKGLSANDFTNELRNKLLSLVSNVQSNWNTLNESDPSYIANKPDVYTKQETRNYIEEYLRNLNIQFEQVQSDWEETNVNSPAYIKNKPNSSLYYEELQGSIEDLDIPNNQIVGEGLSDEVKEAILNLFARVAYISDNGQEYYDALEEAFYPIESISAVFDQGANVIYDTASLDDLKQYLVVTGLYGTNGTREVSNYTLSGTLVAGVSTITVTYKNNITTTFTVNVTHEAGRFSISNNLTNCTTSNNDNSVAENAEYSAIISPSLGYSLTGATVLITMNGVDITSTAYNNGNILITNVAGPVVITVSAVQIVINNISAVYTQPGTIYNTDSLDSLKTNLVVKAHYSDNTEVTLQDNEYSLSGTLSEGTSVITVTYGSFTTTFNVAVSQAVTLSYINADYNQNGTVYETDSIESLRQDLVVEAYYSDNSHRTITDYILSGDLIAGQRVITVTYGGQTTTFTVNVTAVILTGISAVFTQNGSVYTDTPLDSLKNNLVVTASYNNGTSAVISGEDYSLSGTLTQGTSTITVTYNGETTTFNVTVSQAETWDYSWVAATSNHTPPTGMTQHSGYTPVWGTNDEYYEVKDPKLQGATQGGLIGDIVVEVEMKWVEQGSYSAGSTLVVSSAEKTGCKIFLANSSGNVNLYSAPSSGGNYTLKTIGTDWNNFHKYRFELVGDLCKTYIDGVLVDTGYTYYSSWNGYPIIWSENQGNGRSHWAIKSIKYRMSSNS